MPVQCPSRYVGMIVDLLERDGFDCTACLAEAGIDRASFQHLDAVLPLETLAHISHLLSHRSGRSDIFLATGMTCGPAQYGELGRAMLSCANLRDSIALTERYFGLISRVMSLSFEERQGMAEVCWRPVLGLPFDMLMSCFDFVLGAFYNRLVLVFGDDMPDLEVVFATVAPADTSRYRKVKNGRFYFGQGGLPAMRLRLASEHLDIAMPLANPLLLQQTEERVAMFHKLRPAPQRDWQAWAAMMVREAVEHQPTLEELATMSHVSGSTLTRHLSAQGCNFRKMSSEIRHARARTMLQVPGAKVGDVAQILGYTTLGNFIRAFKALEGVSPSQFAAQSGAAVSA